MATRKNIDFNTKSIFEGVTKFGVFIFTVVLSAVCISNLSLFAPNWPFGLFASFLEYLLLATPFVLIVVGLLWRKFLPLICTLLIIGFYPFFTFNKFDDLNPQDCEDLKCLSVVSVNLHHDFEALTNLSQLPKSVEADLILLLDLPYDISETTISNLYPNHHGVRLFERAVDGTALGSAMAIVSKTDVDDLYLIEKGLENPKYNLRGLLHFSYLGPLSEPVDVYVIHPVMPLSREGMTYRDELLDRAISEIGSTDNFILLGDFNLTPWEPKFKDLPGKRAGDPRWVATWDARKPWIRIAIDHVMIGRKFVPVEAEVMPSIGSDHYPIYTVVKEVNAGR